MTIRHLVNWVRLSPRRPLLWVALVSLAVLVPRGLLISRAHSDCIDTKYHVDRGVAFWRGAIAGRELNDPPLGEALLALPLVVTRSFAADPTAEPSIYGHELSPEALCHLIAVWKSLLLVPMVLVSFAWCRDLYGPGAGWLAVALLLIEPTLAAHTPVAALDSIGTTTIVIACFFAWRWVERPNLLRWSAMVFAAAVALCVKHTAIILPGVIGGYALLCWVVRARHSTASLARRVLMLGAAGVASLLLIWPLMGFDVSTPYHESIDYPWPDNRLTRALHRPLPAGMYIRSVVDGYVHNAAGHAAYLRGKYGTDGWWYYFPVVATYKVPVGMLALFAAAVVSLVVVRPRFAEWSLLVPMVAWAAFMMHARINIGFRHFLPVVVFGLMLASRVAATTSARWRVTAWASALIAAAHVLSYHPDYLSYVNFARARPWLEISDSNIDWAQSLKQAAAWARQQPKDRPISLIYFGIPEAGEHYMAGSGVTIADVWDPPTEGLLVISPVRLVAVYDYDRDAPLTAMLRDMRPREVIGHCLLVYDLDNPEPKMD